MRKLLCIVLVACSCSSTPAAPHRLGVAANNYVNQGQGGALMNGADSTGQQRNILVDQVGVATVNTSLNGPIRTTQTFCGLQPTQILSSALPGRGSLAVVNDGAEVWLAECGTLGIGIGMPLVAGSLVVPGGSYSANLGPDAGPLCCEANGSAQSCIDAGPAQCQYTASFNDFPYDGGPSSCSTYDGGVCADGGTGNDCNFCSGTCLVDGGCGVTLDGGPYDGGVVYDGGCCTGGIVIEEAAR